MKGRSLFEAAEGGGMQHTVHGCVMGSGYAFPRIKDRIWVICLETTRVFTATGGIEIAGCR